MAKTQRSFNDTQVFEHAEDANAKRVVQVDAAGIPVPPPSSPTNYAQETGGNLAAIKAKTDNIPSDPAREGGNLSTIAAKDFATQTTLALIKTKTDNLPSDPAREGGNLATLTAKDFATQTTLALIKAKTDNLDLATTALRDALRGVSSKTLSDLVVLLAAGLPPALGTGGGETWLEVGLHASIDLPTQGDVAHDGTDSGNPQKIGGYASATKPTSVSAADRVNAWLDLEGRLAIRAIENDVTILTSASRTTTQTGSDQTNINARGIRVVLDMTTVGTGSVTLAIQAKDAISGKYVALLTGAAVTTNSTNVYVVYPGLTPAANAIVSDVLPRTWRVVVTANNANAATYSVGASYLA